MAMTTRKQPTLYNTMLDVAFTATHGFENPYDLLEEANVHLVLDALQQRIDYLRENPSEAENAFGVCDTYEVPSNETHV